jgi:hypothetical protein
MCEIDEVDVNLYLSETMSDDIIQFIWNIGQTYIHKRVRVSFVVWIRLYAELGSRSKTNVKLGFYFLAECESLSTPVVDGKVSRH